MKKLFSILVSLLVISSLVLATPALARIADPTTTVTMNGNYAIAANFAPTIAGPVHNTNIGQNYATIQAAIDDVHTLNGHTITVNPGRYTENVDFKGKNITLRSTDGAASTTIDGGSAGSVVKFVTGETDSAVLDGFTLTHGSGTLINAFQPFGGGIYITNSSNPTIANCIITGNSADAGGGIMCWYASATIKNSIIRGNTSNNGGGIFDGFASGATIVNSIISGNSSGGYGGGVSIGSANPTIINSTIVGNSAWHGGGGIMSDSNSNLTVVNSIVWSNTADANPEILAGTVNITYSNIEGGHTGTGNINSNPLFRNPAANDYHLQSGSPCIDTGSNAALPAWLTTDFEGDPRIGHERVDMGADEVIIYTLTVNKVGNGSIDPTGTHTYPSGTVVPIVAGPAGGSHFVNWTGDVGTVDDVDSPTTTITMDDDYTVTANFASDAPDLSGWAHKKVFTVSGSSSPLTDYQVKVSVNFVSGQMKADFSDIRFTNGTETALLSHWLESSIASTSAVFWVKVPSIPVTGTTIYLYYGNPSASDASNFDATFIAGNNDFELDAAGTAYDAISYWDHDSWTQNDGGTHGTLGPAGENLNIATARHYSNANAVYSYLQNVCRYNNWDPNSRHTIQDFYTESAYKVVSNSSTLYIWRSDVSYTTSSRYYWTFSIALDDGINSAEFMLHGRAWGNSEGVPGNYVDTHDQTATGTDGQTWYRHPVTIPDYFDKSNLTVRIRHQQDSWDGTTASSSLYYDLIGDIGLRAYASPEPSATLIPDPIVLSNWSYRKTVAITGSAADLTDYQVKIPVSFITGKMNADFSDILFVAANGTTILNHWLESSIASTSAVFWVKVPSIPVAGTRIYMYYGNPGATSASNGENTFIFFDDFSTNKLDQYTNQYLGGQLNGRVVSIENGMLKNSDNGNGDEWYIFTKNGIQLANLAVDIKLVSVSLKSGNHWQSHLLTLTPSQSSDANDVVFGYTHQNAGWPPYLVFGGGGFSERTYDDRDGTGHTLTIAKAGNLFKSLVDGEQYWSFTNDTLGAMSFYAGTYDCDNYEMSSTALYDDFRIRNYALPEPIITIGAEQPLNPVHNIDTGEDFQTIQAAIDDTDTLAGHTITVDEGTYTENVNVKIRASLSSP